MMELGKRIKNKEREFWFLIMGMFMRANLRMTLKREKGKSFLIMVICMMVR